MKETVTNYDLGDSVLCDMCGTDYTKSDVKGGITFGSKAVCPLCTPKIIASAKVHGESGYIKSRCPEDKTFANWVREDLRNGKPGYMTITTF